MTQTTVTGAKDGVLLLLTGLGVCAFFGLASVGSSTVFGDWHALPVALAAGLGWATLVEALWSLRDPATEQKQFARRLFGSGLALGISVARLLTSPPTRTALGEMSLLSFAVANPFRSNHKWFDRAFGVAVVVMLAIGFWRLVPR